jgi:hypothetical protein
LNGRIFRCERVTAFTRLTNGFSKKLDNNVAAVALYVVHYNLCRLHEALRTTPAKAIGVADRAWSIGQLVNAALAVAPALSTETPPDRRRKFRVIKGGKMCTCTGGNVAKTQQGPKNPVLFTFQ